MHINQIKSIKNILYYWSKTLERRNVDIIMYSIYTFNKHSANALTLHNIKQLLLMFHFSFFFESFKYWLLSSGYYLIGCFEERVQNSIIDAENSFNLSSSPINNSSASTFRPCCFSGQHEITTNTYAKQHMRNGDSNLMKAEGDVKMDAGK